MNKRPRRDGFPAINNREGKRKMTKLIPHVQEACDKARSIVDGLSTESLFASLSFFAKETTKAETALEKYRKRYGHTMSAAHKRRVAHFYFCDSRHGNAYNRVLNAIRSLKG